MEAVAEIDGKLDAYLKAYADDRARHDKSMELIAQQCNKTHSMWRRDMGRQRVCRHKAQTFISRVWESPTGKFIVLALLSTWFGTDVLMKIRNFVMGPQKIELAPPEGKKIGLIEQEPKSVSTQIVTAPKLEVPDHFFEGATQELKATYQRNLERISNADSF